MRERMEQTLQFLEKFAKEDEADAVLYHKKDDERMSVFCRGRSSAFDAAANLLRQALSGTKEV